jgi:hypothetical protein
VSAIPPRRRRLTACKEKETKSTKPAAAGKTIASWVDHEDGGILIGNTYSFLTEDHSAETDQHFTLCERLANIADLPKQSAG